MANKKLNLVNAGFTRRADLDFNDDCTSFRGYDYKGLPITYAKYKGDYFLSIRVDYLKNDFTYDDWCGTAAYRLCDEFNGVTEVDVNKLIDNCEVVIKAINELNEKVNNEEVDITPIAEQLEKEIKMAEDVVDNFKNNFKWYDANEYELKLLLNYVKSSIKMIEGAKDLYQKIITQSLDNNDKRSLAQHFKNYRYVNIRVNDFYLTEMKNALNKY